MLLDGSQLTESLLDRAGHGDADARRELLDRYRDHLRRVVAARLDHRLAKRIDASDVVQETLVDAARRMDDYLRDRSIPFFGWLRVLAADRISAAHRCHLETQRRSVMRESPFPELSDVSAGVLCRQLMAHDTSPSNRLLREERRELVMAALAELSPRDREVLVMRHFEKLNTAEIAEALGIAEAGVKARLHRALLRIRRRMEAVP